MADVKTLDINRLLKFTSNDARIGGSNIAMAHKKQILKGIDANDKPFNDYTEKYAIAKAAGKAAKNQISRKVDRPNLTLTGQMLKEFKFIKSRVGGELLMQYGIEDQEQAKKMIANNLGRFGTRRTRAKSGRRRKTVVKPQKSKRLVAANQKVGKRVEAEIGKTFLNVISRNIKKLNKDQVVVVYKV